MSYRRWIGLLAAIMLSMPLQAAEVNIYSARNEALIKPLLDQFTAQSGIRVNLVTGEADALLKRLQFEGRNSPADLLLTVDAVRLYLARDRGLLQPVQSDRLDDVIPESYRDPDGYWYGLSLRARVIAYARDRVDASELGSYADLADPRWRGRLCVRSSSNIYNQSLVASVIAREGNEAAEQWVRGLVANFARPPQGGDRDQINAVAAGQCDIALVNTYYIAGMLDSARQQEVDAAGKVGVHWPDQAGHGVHVNISGVGLTRAARNRKAAVQLMEYMVSDTAQRWYADTNHEYPVKPGMPASELLQGWGEFAADPINMSVLGEYSAEAVRVMDRAGWR